MTKEGHLEYASKADNRASHSPLSFLFLNSLLKAGYSPHQQKQVPPHPSPPPKHCVGNPTKTLPS